MRGSTIRLTLFFVVGSALAIVAVYPRERAGRAIPKPESFAAKVRGPRAAGPIPGTPGTHTQASVIRFTDIAPTPPRERKIVPFMPVPNDMAVPEWAFGTQDPTPAPRPPPRGTHFGLKLQPDVVLPHLYPAAVFSPPPATSFLALDDNGTSIPPDTHGAVGPSHVMTALNTQVRIQDKTGVVLSTVSIDAFWASLGSPDVFDPKVLYDEFADRWMFTACADSFSATSSVLIGVSQTTNPTGLWNLFRIDADPDDIVWADYPSFGFNKDWIVVQMNMFTVAAGSFIRSHVYVFNKADLYANVGATHTLISDNAIGGVQCPAITHDNSIATVFMLQNFNGNSGGNGFIRLFTITGAVGSEVLTPLVFISTPNTWDSQTPGGADFAPQSGSALLIANNDARMQNVVFRNGTIWGVHHVMLPAGGSPTRTAVQWWQLSQAGTILQRARIDDPTGAPFFAFPSIAVNKDDDVLIGYSRFSATQFAGANYSFRTATDPLNTMQSDFEFKAGEAPYFKDFGAGENRWGDYSSTVVDPANDSDVWTLQEYARLPAGTDRWGTFWARVAVDTTAPTITSVTSTTADGTYGVGAAIDVTVNFSEPVTLVGGNLRVTLSTGDIVVIAPFGPAASAAGTYVVGAGDTSPDLNAVSPLTLSAGTLRDGASNNAALTIPGGSNLADLKALVIDSTAPAVTNVTSTTANGPFGIGAAIDVTVNFSEPVTPAGGNLQVTLDTGDVVSILPFGPATSAAGTYTVGAGDNSTDLNAVSPLTLSAGTLVDAGGNAAVLAIPAGQNLANLKNIVIDTGSSAVTSVTSTTANGTFGVGIGDNSPDLTATSPLTLSAGTLVDAVGLAAVLAIPAGQNVGDLENLVIDTTGPPPPTLLLPPDGSLTNDSTPLFDWTDVAGAATYEIQVDNSGPLFPSPEISVAGLTASIFTPAGAPSEGTYSWRARGVDAFGSPGGFSAVFTFVLDTTPPPAVLLISPADGAFVQATPALDGSDSVDAGGVTYQLQVAGDLSFAAPVYASVRSGSRRSRRRCSTGRTSGACAPST